MTATAHGERLTAGGMPAALALAALVGLLLVAEETLRALRHRHGRGPCTGD